MERQHGPWRTWAPEGKMLYAVIYRKKNTATEEELREIRRKFIAWTPPPSLEIKSHYAFVDFGGVIIVNALDNAALRMGLQPFLGPVEFEIEPLVSIAEALAISLDADEAADPMPREAG
jgi:Protein of unknown function (DUF3303)